MMIDQGGIAKFAPHGSLSLNELLLEARLARLRRWTAELDC